MKILRSLRIALCLGLLIGFSMNLFAQKRITLNVKKVSLETFFAELRKQTGVEFVHSEVQAKELQPITMAVKNESLENVLKKVLANSNLGYTLKNNAVLIVPSKTNKGAEGSNSTKINQQAGQDQLSGSVVDSNGEPLAGATIKAMGSNIVVTATSRGTFSIAVPQGTKQLQVSSVGFQTQTVNIEGKTNLKVVLKDGTNELDDAIVVAYGITTKREQTGAVSVVTAKEIADVPASSIGNLLQGRVAGMDVTNMSGSPGGGGTAIVIRGYNSLDVEQERRFSGPLWVVDGVPMSTFTSPITGTNLLSDLNPDMIESIQVLKDASSAAIYGSRAANGVILVTTKKGKSGQKASFSFNASQTLSVMPRLPTITVGRAEREHRIDALKRLYSTYYDATEDVIKYPESLKDIYLNYNQGTLDYFWGAYPSKTPNGNGGLPVYQDSLNTYYNNKTNSFPLFFQTARVTNTNFQSYGGSEMVNYGVGLGYYNEEGIVVETGFNRIDFNTSLQARPVKNALVDARLYLSTGTRKRGTDSGSGSRFQNAPLLERIPGDPMELSSLLPGSDSPMWVEMQKKLKGTKEINRSLRLRPSLTLNYNLGKGLELSSSGSVDYSLERRNYFQPSFLDPTLKGRNQSLGEQGINLMLLNENLLTYRKSFGEHTISLLAGQSYQYDQNEYNGGAASGGPSDLIWYATGGPTHVYDEYNGSKTLNVLQAYKSDMWEKSLLSWFGRAEYNYKQRYLLSLAYRKDGSSVFGDNNKWGSFPSIGVGYNFAEDIEWEPMNFGKFRFSWGRSGLQFFSPYLALGILEPKGVFENQLGLEPSWDKGGLYNQALSWEQTDQYDFGLDLDFFNSRLSVVADYYYRYTDRLLDMVPLPGTYNVYAGQWRNAAAISNEGIELLVKYEVFRRNDLYWKLTLNGARNWNLFAKSYGNYAETSYNSGSVGRVLGKPLNGILVFQTDGFIDHQEEVPYYYTASGTGFYFGQSNHFRPGDWKMNDIDGDGQPSAGDYIHAGSALPIMSGGLGSEFKWKGLELNWLFSFQLGRHMVNIQPFKALFTGHDGKPLLHPLLVDKSDFSFWEKPGDNQADFPFYRANMNNFLVDRYVQNVSWLKLKTVVLGYNWSNQVLQKAGITQLRFFASGENLFTWSNYDGLDPEIVDISTGFDEGRNYPLARKLTLGITLKF